MKKDVKNTFHDDIEPTVGHGGAVYLPMWLTGLLAMLLYWACYHVDEYGGQFSALVHAPYMSTNELASVIPSSGPNPMAGRPVYDQYCGPCHQPTGLGSAGVAPPLAGSEWVIDAPARLIRIPQCGLTGPITVKGQQWNLSMLAIGQTLSDNDLAAVLTYIRAAWGNSAPPITAADVKKVRAEVGSCPEPLTAEQYKAIPVPQ